MDERIRRASLPAHVVAAALLIAMAGCQRAKPPREVQAPPLPPTAAVIQPQEAPVEPALVEPLMPTPTPEGGEQAPSQQPELPEVEPLDVEPTPLPTVAMLTPTPVPAEITYIVQVGDTLLGIAIAHDTTTNTILARNPLADPHMLRLGQKLIVPVGPDYRPPAPRLPEGEQRTHVVQPGESLSEIAERYGLRTRELARANGIGDLNQITVGQVLVIPN